MKTFLLTITLFGLGIAVRFGWNAITATPTAPEAPAIEWAAQTDVWVESELAAGAAAPARGWLAADGHLTFEAPPAAVDALIESFHAAGAERVWMVAIEEMGESQVSDTIAVELPPAGPARDRVFAVEARYWDGDGSRDVGQRYLTVSFD